ncbi:hypothetical protein [Allokutzneria oryzae]|uniref:DUF998 domain-containing protein n=1 Tax=Allokutzneria oryzae TaxID=1378989 RepID=A0ABV5ZP04_9PSEU
MSRLEQRYRRMLLVLPRWYREEREEEMVAAFLADTDEHDELRHEFGWPGWGEFGSLVALSARTRWPGTVGSPRALVKGQVVRLVALIGLLTGSVTATWSLLMRVAPGLFPSPYSRVEPLPVDWYEIVALTTNAVTVFTFLALLWGARRVALGGAGVLLTLQAYHLVEAVSGPVNLISILVAFSVVSTVYVLCAFAGFHSDAPRIRGARWWLVALVALSAFSLAGMWSPVFVNHVWLFLAAAVGYLVVHYKRLWRAPAAWLIAVAVVFGLTAVQRLAALPYSLGTDQVSWTAFAFLIAEPVVLVASAVWLRAEAVKTLPPRTRSALTVTS